jgi:hypothetical protein
MSYATVSNLREYLTQVATGATVDAQLQRILDRANAIVNEALGIEFAAFGATASERDLRGSYDHYLRPPAFKASSIVGIEAVYARGTSDEDTEAITDWIEDTDARPYRIYRYDGWAETWYRVEAIWGYGAAPASVVEVELEVAINVWRSRDAASFGTAIGPDDGGGITINRALTWAQRDILRAVRASYLGVVHA